MPSWSLPISVRLHSWRAGRGVQRERGVVRGRVDHPADHVDAVRAAVGRVVGVRPEHPAGGQADRHHVGLQVLDVDHAVHDHRGGRVGAVGVRGRGPQRHGPGHAELRDVRAGDRAGHVAGVGQVGARQRPARRGPAGRGDRAARGDRLPGLGRAGRRGAGAATAAAAAADGQARGQQQGEAGHRGPPARAGHGVIPRNSSA